MIGSSLICPLDVSSSWVGNIRRDLYVMYNTYSLQLAHGFQGWFDKSTSILSSSKQYQMHEKVNKQYDALTHIPYTFLF